MTNSTQIKAIKKLLSLIIPLLFSNISRAQNISGKITNSSKESLIGAYITVPDINGIGTISDENGLFKLSVNSFPVTLKVAYLGYDDNLVVVKSPNLKLAIIMKESKENVLTGAVVKASRITEKQKEAPLTVESIGIKAIKDAPAASFYESLGNLKGVDVTAASLGFRVVNTRGFNSTSPVRSLQLIDGVDNQSPGLNFSLGNFLGASDIDIQRVNVIAGASSAFYGPNAFNGVISMETKSPFLFPGVMAEIKVGERQMGQVQFRIADYFINKKEEQKFGYKLTASYMQANDWEAENYQPTEDSDFDGTNPGGYDAVNRYGDENYEDRLNPTGHLDYPGLGAFYRTGYREVDLVDYSTDNIKLNTALFYKFSKETELEYAFNFSGGSTVYQGDNRYKLENIRFWQNKIELRNKGKYFLRAYSTNEDAGDTYDIVATGFELNNRAIDNNQWFTSYANRWRQPYSAGFKVKKLPGYPTYSPSVHDNIFNWIDNYLNPFLAQYQDSISAWHEDIRALNDGSGGGIYSPRFLPGTSEFDSVYQNITTTLFTENGTRFFDQSALYHAQGEYVFTPSFGKITVGANGRLYRPNSRGTILKDTGNVTITNYEGGVYGGVEKRWLMDRVIANITARLDKNQNFDFLVSPASSFIYKHRTNHVFRASFSSAIRNPTLADQYLYYDVGRARLLGNLEGYDSLIDIQSFLDYSATTLQPDLLKYFDVAPIRPEQAKTIEFGYKGNIFNQSLFIDGGYYFTSYTNFIGYNIGIDADIDPLTNFPTGVGVYRVAANAKSRVTTQGVAIGLNYYFKKYALGGNYSWNQLNKKGTDDPIIPAFNTPEHKFNISFSGEKLKLPFIKGEHFGFGMNYKWIEGFVFEGSPQFTGAVPTYDMLDIQINYQVPSLKTTFKLGASNLLGLMPLFDAENENTQRTVFNNLNYQVYGGPYVGRLIYFSIQTDLKFIKK
ncbi:MAG: TonB-dependent receptor plug domain-containing protein [Bacteroidia bacterium]|nr:TonB-dependent receptor plug domain-containing protein [Bacteroidia bacterium]